MGLFFRYLIPSSESNSSHKRTTDIFKLGGNVYAFDSTTIDLCLSVFWWAKFRKKKGGINIVIEQCNSGGFISHLAGNNRVIATACKADELSYAGQDLLYNEFIYHWMSAALGKKIDSSTIVSGDTNNDGFVTARECFVYARSNDTRLETPQYSSVVENLGEKLPLNGVGDIVDCRIWINGVHVAPYDDEAMIY